MQSNGLQQSSRNRNIEPRPWDGIIIIEYVPGIVPGRNASASTATTRVSSTTGTEPPTTTTSQETRTTASHAHNSISTLSRILKLLKPTGSLGGVKSVTLLIFALQLTLLGATAITWFFSTRLVKHAGSASSSVIVHAFFVFATTGQLIFLERRCCRIRSERYSYLHSGEILPRHRGLSRGADAGITFSSWNQPPPPTYAAALAQSSFSTDDVENQLMDAAPPPAYGDTRGSRLLLQGHSLRAQWLPSVVNEAPSERDRPISYSSRDERWEEIEEADHEWQLDAALSCAVGPHSRSTSGQSSSQGHRAS